MAWKGRGGMEGIGWHGREGVADLAQGTASMGAKCIDSTLVFSYALHHGLGRGTSQISV